MHIQKRHPSGRYGEYLFSIKVCERSLDCLAREINQRSFTHELEQNSFSETSPDVNLNLIHDKNMMFEFFFFFFFGGGGILVSH